MELAVRTKEVEWWFWALTLVFIIFALSGWIPGYYFVIAISYTQIFYFAQKEGSLMSFSTQVRIFYFACTLLGLWTTVRLPLFIILLFGTASVTFTGNCFIAPVLKALPWNKNLMPGASCGIGSE